jgi:plastocyanin
VEWANNDLTPHTVTSQNGGEFDSGSIEVDASWSHTFGQTGTFPYYCSFHPEMKGAVIVK